MEFNQHITTQQQVAWFNKLAQARSYYFTIHAKETAIGLMHLNEFDDREQSANVGLFIGDQAYLGSGITLGASLLILDFAFGPLNLEKLRAKVKNTNATAIRYNAFLGFSWLEPVNETFGSYIITKEAYLGKKTELSKLASSLVS